MPKVPVSVTLDADNLLWLRARTTGAKRRSLSDLLDEIVSAARAGSRGTAVRSVVGTIDIAPDDPGLERADAIVRAEFDASLARPILIHEDKSAHRTPGTRGSARPARARRT